MNPVQNTPNSDNGHKTPVISVPTGGGKESEAGRAEVTGAIEEIGSEAELPKEVESSGVKLFRDSIELPPDVRKMGVAPTGVPPSVPAVATIPSVVLPISDPEVAAGLHAQILSSIRWLAVWCLKRLKKAHITLKKIHGKIIRVKI